MTIETYVGQKASDFPYIPQIPRPICGYRAGEDIPEELKGPLILFSGGLDSTYLVYETLKTTNVHLVYVVGNVYTEKMKLELAAREKIKQWFTDNPHSEFKIISDTVLHFEIGDFRQMFNGVKLTQPAMWLFPSLYFYKSGLHTSVQIGYVKDDVIIPYLVDLKNAWSSLTKVVKSDFVPLLFPLVEVDKVHSYSTLPHDLRSLIWVCNNPQVNGQRQMIECGRCGPCARRLTYIERNTNET